MVLLPVITFTLTGVIIRDLSKKIFLFFLLKIILLIRYRDDPTIIPPTVKNWDVPRT